MNTRSILVSAIVFVLLLSSEGRAAGFNDQQFQDFDGLVSSVLSGLKEDPSHIDAMLDAVKTAYAGSPFGKDEAAQMVRQRLGTEGEKVKKAIAALQIEIAEQKPRDRDPAVMLLLLSKEQTVSFVLYKWCRSAAELGDAANLVAGKGNSAGGELFAGMAQVHETVQDTVGTAIQVIATRFLDKQ